MENFIHHICILIYKSIHVLKEIMVLVGGINKLNFTIFLDQSYLQQIVS